MALLKLVLPSDSNSVLYPENKIGHYRVRFSQPVSNGTEIALAAITYTTNTTSSGFYVTLPGLVNNVCSPAGSSCVRNVVISNQNMMTFNNLFFMPLKKGTDFIREIEVDIIDSSTGKTVDFKDGKLICTFLISYDICGRKPINRGEL